MKESAEGCIVDPGSSSEKLKNKLDWGKDHSGLPKAPQNESDFNPAFIGLVKQGYSLVLIISFIPSVLSQKDSLLSLL